MDESTHRASDNQPESSEGLGRAWLPLQLAADSPPNPPEGGGMTYRVTFIRSGYVRRRDGKQAPWRIPPETLQAAVPLLEGRAVFLDHAGLMEYPSLRNLAGVTFAPEWNEGGGCIDGCLRLHETETGRFAAELLGQILADQMRGREAPDVGLSLVFYGRHEYERVGESASQREEQEYERVTVAIEHVESCDLVFGPGADGRIREALSAVGASATSAPAGAAPQEPPQPPIGGSNPSEFSPGGTQPAGAQITQLNGGVSMDPEEVQQVQLNSETPATPPAAPVVSAESDRLARLEQAIERLTAALGRQEEPNVVQGLGSAPRDSGPGPRLWGMQTGLDRFSSNIEWLFGVPGAALPDPQYRKADMLYQAMTGDWEWRGIFRSDRVELAGVNATDLPNLAVDAMNKVITLQWASLRAYRWYELVAAVVPNDGSVQPMTWVGAGGVEVLPVVAEKGPYTELSLADSKESDAFTKYGGYVGITLEMFRKSEIAKIQAVPLGLARSSVMKRSANIAAIFTASEGVGPTLDIDSKALFHDDHGNIATTAFGTDATAWSACDLAIWGQAELGSTKPLAISPKYMLCHRSLYRQALIVFGYGDGQPTSYTPEAMDRGPDDPRPWPVAVPDFTDTTDWAAVVDPKVYPVIMMSYAQGSQGGQHPLPELFAVTDERQGLMFTNDVMPIKVRDWYAYGVNGYRGIAKRNVT